MKSILVVEDDDDFRGLLVEVLEEEGHTVRAASNGREAIAVLSEFVCELVLLDLVMPKMGGRELYLTLQNNHAWKHIPVIIMTSDGSKAPSGALVMTKPVNVDRLLRLVSNM
jgi:CheY-like chemotaxis protein